MKALLLDLDNTLIDRDAAVLAWLRETLPSHAQGEENVRALVAKDRGGRGSKAAFFTLVGARAQVSPHEARKRFYEELPQFVRLKPDADALLRSFRGSTAVVTNGPSALQRAKLVAAGLSNRIEHVLISDEHGVRKPDAALFRMALSLVGCSADQALMVGDDPRTDIAGARAAGIAAVHVRTRWSRTPTGVRGVRSLTEITW